MPILTISELSKTNNYPFKVKRPYWMYVDPINGDWTRIYLGYIYRIIHASHESRSDWFYQSSFDDVDNKFILCDTISDWELI